MKNRNFKTALLLLGMTLFNSGMLKSEPEPCKRLLNLKSWMLDSLSLTSSQRIEIEKATDSACAQIQQLRSLSSGDKEADKEKFKLAMKQLHEKYKSTLSSEQLEKLKAHRESNSRRSHNPALTPEEKAQRMTDTLAVQLGLTVAQKKEVSTLNLNLVMARISLRDSAKAAGGEVNKAEMKTIHKEYKTAMLKLLNDEQDTLFEKFIADKKADHKQGHSEKH